MSEMVREFGDELLVPLPGDIVYIPPTISRGGPWRIEIPIAPFSASDQYETDWRPGTEGPEIIHTSIRLDSIDPPGESLADLAGRTFLFPTNPTPGYIDGSIYLGAAHNPVDVTEITFGDLDDEDDVVSARLHTVLVFEHELWGVQNRTATIESRLSFERRI